MIGLAMVHGWVAGLSQAATGGVVAAVWQGVLLAAAAALALRLLPKTPAAVRFAIWFAVFVIVAALPLLSLVPHAPGVARPEEHSPWLTLGTGWAVAIAAIWLLASLVRAGTLLLAAMRVRALWKRATPVEIGSSMNPGLGGAAGRRAQLCTSDEIDRPAVIGFFAPRILIPGWLLEKLTASELEQIVLHEAGHLGRADDWMKFLQKIALVVFPLNPALAWIERRLCFERELACDERVLRATGAAKAYAACLATLAEYRMGRRGLALALGALGRESELTRRVGQILARRERMKPLHSKLVLGCAMLGLLVGAGALERCPQVVGFTPEAISTAEVQSASVLPTVRTVAGLPRYGYQAVVFHPAATRSAAAPANRMSIAKISASALRGNVAQGRVDTFSHSEVFTSQRQALPPIAIRAVAKAPVPADGVMSHNTVLRNPTAGTEMVHVVITAWESADGSRLVLTTVSTSSGASSMAQTAQPQPQALPYAAVPVRDGWLIFQL